MPSHTEKERLEKQRLKALERYVWKSGDFTVSKPTKADLAIIAKIERDGKI